MVGKHCRMHIMEKKRLLWEKKEYIGAFLAVQGFIVLMRLRAYGMYHAQLSRLHEMLNLQLLMCALSSVIYRRIKELIKPVAVTVQDSVKTIALLCILSSHLSFMFFYIYWPDGSLISTICFISLSIYVHLGFFMMILLTVELISSRLKFWPKSLAVFRSKKYNTVLSLLLAFFFTGAGFAVTRSAPVINRVNVKIRKLPQSLDGFTIVLLTDVHVGPTVDQKRIEEIVAKTNALHPDMVAIAGDLVDGFLPNLAQRTRPLANLNTKYGVYFATGNHEYYHGDVDQWLHYFTTTLNITTLHNEHRKLCVGIGDCLCVAGVDDFYTEKLRIRGHHMDAERALDGCSDTEPVVLLVHQPNGASKIVRDTRKRIDLILSGHTHGGQLYIMWLFAYLNNAFLYGHYRLKNSDTQIYVSSGVNYWGPPVKMLNLCEIALLTLHA